MNISLTNRLILVLMLLAITAGAQPTAPAPEKSAATLISVGQMVPDFKFEIAKGKSASIKEYRGKMVLINFFATWCAPCRRELPLVQQRIWDKWKNNPKFAMLTFGREHSWDEVVKFGEAQKLAFSLLPDPERKVYARFATQTIPRSFLIDETGKVIFTSEDFNESHFNELVKTIDAKLQ